MADAQSFTEARQAQKRYTALARWHVEQGDKARADLDFESAGKHFLAANLAGQCAILEKLRQVPPTDETA